MATCRRLLPLADVDNSGHSPWWDDGQILWWCHSQVTRDYCGFCLVACVSLALRSSSLQPRCRWHARSTPLHTLTYPQCAFLPPHLQMSTPVWKLTHIAVDPISGGGDEFIVNCHCSCQLHVALLAKCTTSLTSTSKQKWGGWWLGCLVGITLVMDGPPIIILQGDSRRERRLCR